MRGINFYEQLLAMPDLQLQRVEYPAIRITLFCRLKTPHQPCPQCLKSISEVDQITNRQVRDLNMSGRQVWLPLRIRQLIYKNCNRYFSKSVGLAQDGKSYTAPQLCSNPPAFTRPLRSGETIG